MSEIRTIDCEYTKRENVAAAFLLLAEDSAAFVETNTNHAVGRLMKALEDAGRAPEEVEFIIITHVHLDHAGGAGEMMRRCPNATLLAHPRAVPHAIDPSKLIKSARQVYGDAHFSALYGDIQPVQESRVRALDDEESVAFGDTRLRFLHTRGHANHHFCVVDEEASAIFTGDSFGLVYPFVQDNGVFALASTTPTDFDAKSAHESVDRIVELGVDTAYLTHFGPQTAFREIATQLHEQIDRYAQIAEQAYTDGVEDEALDEWVLNRVREMIAELIERNRVHEHRDFLDFDTLLNAQGIAFSVRKRRYKESRSNR